LQLTAHPIKSVTKGNMMAGWLVSLSQNGRPATCFCPTENLPFSFTKFWFLNRTFWFLNCVFFVSEPVHFGSETLQFWLLNRSFWFLNRFGF
jgi:hypothetical protein